MDRLRCTRDEYRTLLQQACDGSTAELANADRDRCEAILSRDGDWTRAAAGALVYLATEYGSFMLRNALALAMVLGIEDGEAGM